MGSYIGIKKGRAITHLLSGHKTACGRTPGFSGMTGKSTIYRATKEKSETTCRKCKASADYKARKD